MVLEDSEEPQTGVYTLVTFVQKATAYHLSRRTGLSSLQSRFVESLPLRSCACRGFLRPCLLSQDPCGFPLQKEIRNLMSELLVVRLTQKL